MKFLLTLLLLTFPIILFSVSDEERELIKRLEKIFLDKRIELIAPKREKLIQECISKDSKSEERCRRYYKDYGLGAWTSSGRQHNLFWGIPECDEAFKAKKKYK